MPRSLYPAESYEMNSSLVGISGKGKHAYVVKREVRAMAPGL